MKYIILLIFTISPLLNAQTIIVRDEVGMKTGSITKESNPYIGESYVVRDQFGLKTGSITESSVPNYSISGEELHNNYDLNGPFGLKEGSISVLPADEEIPNIYGDE